MTDEEAKELLKQLTKHYNQPVKPVEEYCSSLEEWAELNKQGNDRGGVVKVTSDVFRQISKSCLLSRTLYCGEKPSQTKCPVHDGFWSGLHNGWPNTKWSDGTPITVDPFLQKWYDAGCRCYQHKCGCTTGWQPDAACGCGVKE
jgi:hypothetical protein